MSYQILTATETTLAEIEVWLDEEEALHKDAEVKWVSNGYVGEIPPRGFRCNWDKTKDRWREQGGGIDVLIVDGQAIGFQGFGIFEIRPDMRRKGYGRVLAEHMLNHAFDEGRTIMEISIAPITAQPFWHAMGFTLVQERPDWGGGTFAYKKFPRSFDLGNGDKVPFLVEFYAPKAKYDEHPTPFSTFAGFGERLADGTIQLPERAYCFDPLADANGNWFVRIEVDGTELHFDKLKRDRSKLYGVSHDAGYTYFVDRIKADVPRDIR